MRKTTYLTLVLLFTLLTACSKFEKLRKNSTDEEKYKAALDYYKKGSFEKAGLLFEELKPLLKGSDQQEMATFYEAYCNYRMGLYALSAQQFRQFYETFGRSEYAEEALYMSAYSLYKDSPNFNLDQVSTSTAIDALQSFVNGYSQSKFREEATEIMKELRIKLEKKAYEKAVLYYKTSPASILNFRSAVVAMTNFQRDFPDSDLNEDVAYRKVQAQHDYAKNSSPKKQKERFDEAVLFYQAFIDKYPNSKFLRIAEKFYDNSTKELARMGAEAQLAKQQPPSAPGTTAPDSKTSKLGGSSN
ncbi:MAG: outer membrane protein assembly factor BamD [Cytophagaceae bacterium]|nr:outer membrane protein assembly factor BamD [Cytophagaceae bacterium]